MNLDRAAPTPAPELRLPPSKLSHLWLPQYILGVKTTHWWDKGRFQRAHLEVPWPRGHPSEHGSELLWESALPGTSAWSPCCRAGPGACSRAAAKGRAHVLPLSLPCFHESLMHLLSLPGSEMPPVSLHSAKARLGRMNPALPSQPLDPSSTAEIREKIFG